MQIVGIIPVGVVVLGRQAISIDRGVYRSQDGGLTWTKVLFVSDIAGAVDLAIDPVDPSRR